RTFRSRSARRSSGSCSRRWTTSRRLAVSSSRTSTTTVEVTMPQMGVSVAEGTIVEWRKRVGDWVEADEAIVEISTDKVETEIPSPASGRVAEILVEPGATVDVGTVLCRLDVDARPGEAHVDEGSEPEVASSQLPVASPGNGHAPPISPVVRRM